MLEKSGTILLTDNDIAEYRAGNVSDRITQTWGLSFEQLQDVITKNNYTKLEEDNE